MRRVAARAVAALAVLAAAACAESRSEAYDCTDFVMSPSQYMEQFAGRPGQETQQELSFVCHATLYGRAQLIFARMAQERAADPAVKAFAAQVSETQSRMNHRLNQIAIEQEGVRPPSGLDAADLAAREQLAALSGHDFDRVYLRHIAEQGKAAIALFHKGGALREPLLNKFAVGAQPALEERVTQAEGLLQQSRS
jgi:putative membrane protein